MRNQLEPLFPGIQEQYQTIKSQLETLKNQRQEIESADHVALAVSQPAFEIIIVGAVMKRGSPQAAEHRAAVQQPILNELAARGRIQLARFFQFVQRFNASI